MEYDHLLDTTGKACPVPLLELTKEIKKVEHGKILKIISTDPGCKSNVPIWCRRHKQELISSIITSDRLVFYIRKN